MPSPPPDDAVKEPAQNIPSEEKRSPRPTFEAFALQWRASVADKNAAAQLRPLLKGGYTDDFRPDHATLLCDAAMEKPEVAERIGALLAAQKRFGKLNLLSRSVLDELRRRFRASLEYYEDEFRGANGAHVIETFIRDRAPHTRMQPKRTDGHATTPAINGVALNADAWLRRFFICLCAEPESKVFLAGTIAVGKWWLGLQSPGPASEQEDASLARVFSAAIAAGTVSRPKLDLIFSGIRPLARQFTTLLSRELDLMRRMQNSEMEIEALKREQGRLESALAESRQQVRVVEQDKVALQDQLAEAEERYRLLDQHWRGVSDQTLRKQSGSFRERVGHELQEALLGLERETPNVSMALTRLKRIQEILKNSNAKEE